MRLPLTALLLGALLLSGCAGSGTQTTPGNGPRVVDTELPGFPRALRADVLERCLTDGRVAAEGAVTPEQQQQACGCLLGRIEQDHSPADYQELLARAAPDRLPDDEALPLAVIECAREATSE